MFDQLFDIGSLEVLAGGSLESGSDLAARWLAGAYGMFSHLHETRHAGTVWMSVFAGASLQEHALDAVRQHTSGVVSERHEEDGAPRSLVKRRALTALEALQQGSAALSEAREDHALVTLPVPIVGRDEDAGGDRVLLVLSPARTRPSLVNRPMFQGQALLVLAETGNARATVVAAIETELTPCAWCAFVSLRAGLGWSTRLPAIDLATVSLKRPSVSLHEALSVITREAAGGVTLMSAFLRRPNRHSLEWAVGSALHT